ncbi:MAG: hypothetical protein R3D80_03010 [Paracoccaceae bacterium]
MPRIVRLVVEAIAVAALEIGDLFRCLWFLSFAVVVIVMRHGGDAEDSQRHDGRGRLLVRAHGGCRHAGGERRGGQEHGHFSDHEDFLR